MNSSTCPSRYANYFLMALTLAVTGCTHSSDEVVVWAEPLEGAAMTSEQIDDASGNALRGSAEDAHRISVHYLIATNDADKQLYWTRIAAENGDASAQFNLADLLLQEGSVESTIRAKFWLGKAALQGNSDAKDRLEHLANELQK